MIPEILKWYSEKARQYALIAIVGLPFIVVLALFMALRLWLKGDKRYKELL